MIRLAFSLGFAMVGFHAWIASLPVALHDAGRPDAEIGTVVGAAAIFAVVVALAAGAMIDRYGGRAVYLVGGAAFIAAAAPVALGLVGADSPLPVLLGLRFLQGAGQAAVLPAVMTLVPGQVSGERLPTAIAVVGVAGNLSLAISPMLSLVLLERWGLPAVGLAVCLAGLAGTSLIWRARDPERDALSAEAREAAAHRFRPRWRPAWAAPLAITFLFVAHWGVVTAYLPQRAELAGADIGLYFTADALALLMARVPAGWLAGRIGSLPVLLGGIGLTFVALALLLMVPTTGLLLVSGALGGVGSALAFPVLNLELTRRSDATDRGSAFGLYTVAFGAAIAAGSVGVAAVYDRIGFGVAMLGSIAMLLASSLVALADTGLRERAPLLVGTAPDASLVEPTLGIAQPPPAEPAPTRR